MDFIGKICPYCQTEFKEGDDVVVCSVCEMPHHKECWIENKACTTFGCTGTIVGAEQYVEAVENKIFCSKCGAPMKEGQKFCSSCGTPAGAIGEPHFRVAEAPSVSQVYQQNAGYNLYGQEKIDPDAYSFIGTKYSTYFSSFQKMQMSNTKTTWNWSAFLFGGLWFAYRKMYGLAAAYIGICIVFGIIPGLGSLVEMAMTICAALFGNYLYKQYVERELQVAKSMDTLNKTAYIAKKGGTSIGAVFAVFGIALVIGLIIAGSSM